MSRVRVFGLVAVATVAACDADGSGGTTNSPPLPFAAAHRDCAPWDGSAVRVILATQPVAVDSNGFTSVSPPTLDLAVYTSLDLALGHRFELGSSGAGGQWTASASWCGIEASCTSADNGWIRMQSQRGDTVFGTYDVSFADHTRHQGGFAAKWRNVIFLCG